MRIGSKLLFWNLFWHLVVIPATLAICFASHEHVFILSPILPPIHGRAWFFSVQISGHACGGGGGSLLDPSSNQWLRVVLPQIRQDSRACQRGRRWNKVMWFG
jgi:hypothetical protein